MADEWYYEQFENHTRLGMQVRRRLVSERSDFQKIELFEAERYGRVLALDGVYQTSEAGGVLLPRDARAPGDDERTRGSAARSSSGAGTAAPPARS